MSDVKQTVRLYNTETLVAPRISGTRFLTCILIQIIMNIDFFNSFVPSRSQWHSYRRDNRDSHLGAY